MTLYLSNREIYDLECILVGAFSPLNGFMKKVDYLSVINTMHLSTEGEYKGNLWTIPITLYTEKHPDMFVESIIRDFIELKNSDSETIATLHNIEFYKPDINECKVYGNKIEHSEIKTIKRRVNHGWYVGGIVKANETIKNIYHSDFNHLRLTPAETKDIFRKCGKANIIGFQTRNPMHRAHFKITQLALNQESDSLLFIQPTVGPTKKDDIDYFTRVKCYEAILHQYKNSDVLLGLAPLAMRMAGPREAVHHAIVRQNYGCTHFIIGRDHAGLGDEFYDTYEAQQLAVKLQDELKIRIIPVPEININNVQISGTIQRDFLRSSKLLPKEFTFPEVAKELQKWYNIRNKKGFCIFFYGLSGAGKTTLANMTSTHIKSCTGREVTLLDGDVVRKNISSDLGFSKEDRSENVRRVGWIAKEIVKHGGIVICANMAPYENDRLYNREIIESYGIYLDIFVDTPLDVCKKRDPKKLYQKESEGKVSGFIYDIEEGEPDLIVKLDDINSQMSQIIKIIPLDE